MSTACSACGAALIADAAVGGLEVCSSCGRFPAACPCTPVATVTGDPNIRIRDCINNPIAAATIPARDHESHEIIGSVSDSVQNPQKDDARSLEERPAAGMAQVDSAQGVA